MLRRFSPFQLAWALVVAALWGAVLSDQRAREVAHQQLHIALVPPSRNIYYDSLDENRADDRIVRASTENKRARPLIDGFPDDVALLAVYVRGHDAIICRRGIGPLLSDYNNWLMQGGIAQSKADMSNRPSPSKTEEVLVLAARGQKLEPQNTFWDWMEMAALLAAGRENELVTVLNRAAGKREWNDHVTEEMRATTSWNERERSVFSPGAKTIGYSSVPLRHLASIRNVTRALAQQVMGLRLQKRDKEALQVGMQTMRLARLIRLNANVPITSTVGTACERIILRKARVPLGKGTPPPSPLSALTLAKSPESLLFLAQKISPPDAKVLDSEWTRLNGWGIESVPDLFGGLVARSSLERVGWATRVGSYCMMASPVALVVWLVLGMIGWRWNTPAMAPSRWGQIAGVLLLGGFVAFDWITRTLALQANQPGSFCDVNCTVPEELLFSDSSLLEAHGLMRSGITLWLGMFAFYGAFATYKAVTQPKKRGPQLQEGHPIDILWDGLKWLWRGQGRLWALSAPLWILGVSLTPALGLDSSDGRQSFAWNFVGVTLSLAVWPLAVGVRQLAIFFRTRQRTAAPTRFIGIWHAALGNFIVLMLLVLPVLIWSQSRFEQDFNRQFAPIEQGRMVVAIQKMRGAPMQ